MFTKKKFLGIAAIATSLATSGAHPTLAQSACASVYESAVANVSTSSRTNTERSYVFNLYCKSTGKTKEWVSSASVSFPIKGIPVSASGDGDFTQVELEEFCDVGVSQNYAFGAEFGYNRDIAVDALNSFNQCVALERARGLVLSHQAASPTSVLVSGQFKTLGNAGTLDAVEYDKTLVSCSSANFNDNGTSEELHGSMARPIGQFQFSITCRRKSTSLDDGQFYPRATVQIGTSFGAYTVIMPSEKLFGFQTASAAEAANAEMTARLAQAEASSQSNAQRADSLQSALKNHRILSVYQGDGGWTGARDVHEACPQNGGEYANRDSYMKNVCVRNGLKYSGWKFTGDVAGGTCGHSWYAVMCY